MCEHAAFVAYTSSCHAAAAHACRPGQLFCSYQSLQRGHLRHPDRSSLLFGSYQQDAVSKVCSPAFHGPTNMPSDSRKVQCTQACLGQRTAGGQKEKVALKVLVAAAAAAQLAALGTQAAARGVANVPCVEGRQRGALLRRQPAARRRCRAGHGVSPFAVAFHICLIHGCCTKDCAPCARACARPTACASGPSSLLSKAQFVHRQQRIPSTPCSSSFV
jgi:hypothetical protein